MYSFANFAGLFVLALGIPAHGIVPVKRADAQVFLPPAFSPFSTSSNYVGQNNGTLPKTNVVSGKFFDRFIQIWLENTDYQLAASTPEFQALAKQGLVLDSYYALTHVRCRSLYILCGSDPQLYLLYSSRLSQITSPPCQETFMVSVMMNFMPFLTILRPLLM